MDQQLEIKNMINTMSTGKYSEVQAQFDSLMSSRATAAIADYKAEFAKSIFKNKDVVSVDNENISNSTDNAGE